MSWKQHNDYQQPPQHLLVSHRPQPSRDDGGMVLPISSAEHQPKALTAAEIEIVRQSRSTTYYSSSKATTQQQPQQSSKTPAKLPYIVRKKAKGPS